MLLRGVEFLIVGMSVVFVFLVLMVLLMIFVSFLVRRFGLTSEEEEKTGGGAGGESEGEIAAAIAAVRALQKSQ